MTDLERDSEAVEAAQRIEAAGIALECVLESIGGKIGEREALALYGVGRCIDDAAEALRRAFLE